MPDYYQQQFEQKSEELRKNFHDQCERLEDKIEAQNNKISERAIEKTLKIVSVIGGSLVAFIFLFGILGYGDIKESVTQTFTRKVDKWLEIENNISPLKESLLSIRDRTLLDSLYIRLQRSKIENRKTLELSNSEIGNIIRLANKKDLSLNDYRNILEIFHISQNPFGIGFGGFYGDYKSNLFDKIMTESGFTQQAEKQKAFFESFKYDRNILKYVNGILENTDHHLRNYAFDALVQTNPSKAKSYIENNFEHTNNDELKFSMVKFMIDKWIYIEDIKKYSNFLLNNKSKNEFWSSKYVDLLISIIEEPEKKGTLFYSLREDPNQEKVSLSAKMLENIINSGASIDLAEHIYNKGKIVISFPENISVYLKIHDFDKLYGSRETIRELIDKNKNNTNFLSKIISFYEVRNKENYIISVTIDIKKKSKIIFEDGMELKSDDIIGKLWLTVDSEMKLIATYKDRTSNIISNHVKKLIDINGQDFNFIYNETEIRNLVFRTDEFY